MTLKYKSYYKILDIDKDADKTAVEDAYGNLLKEYADKTDSTEYIIIKQAYKTLKDTIARNRYDRFLKEMKEFTTNKDDEQKGIDGRSATSTTEVRGKDIIDFLKDIISKNANRIVRVRHRDQVVWEMPQTLMLGAGIFGLFFAPLWTIILSFGLAAVFEIEIVDIAIEKFNDAVKIHKSERYSEALEAYNKVIGLDEYYAPTYLNLGLFWNEIGDLYQAIENYKKVIKVDNDKEANRKAQANLKSIRGY